MNDLCADIGYKSINHIGEELCGDHVDVVDDGGNSTVIVLADGLGSGVKASILSTLTSKIISTMMAAGLPIEECVATIAGALPVCSVRGVAYSTFTIIHLLDNEIAEIIQYDNPHVIVIRNFEQYDYPKTEMNIGGKKIFKSVIKLQEDDVFIAMSDGCPHAGMGGKYNFGWRREEIADYMQTLVAGGYTAKKLADEKGLNPLQAYDTLLSIKEKGGKADEVVKATAKVVVEETESEEKETTKEKSFFGKLFKK
jgi:hypothetical protein